MGLLHNRYFLLFSIKNAATSLGYTLYMITIPAYAFLISHSIFFTGLALFVEYGIYTLTAFTGPLVDRVNDKRYIIAASEIGIGIVALILGILMIRGFGNHYFLLLLIGLIAVLWDIAWTADHLVLPLIVSDKELGRANGIQSAIGNGHTAAGLGIGGFLFAVLLPFYSILLYSACLFISGAVVLAIPLRIRGEKSMQNTGLRAGWKYLFTKQRTMVVLAVLIGLFSIFANAPVLAVAYLYADSSPLFYSVLFSLFYIGSMLSGLFIARRFPGKNLGRVLLLTYFLSGALLIFSVKSSLPLAILVLVWMALGFSFSIHTPLFTTYLQSLTSKEMLGRTASSLYTFRGITTTAGTLLIPLMVERAGLMVTFLSSGLVIMALALSVFVLLPQIRAIRL